MYDTSREFTTPIVTPLSLELDFRRVLPLAQIGVYLAVVIALLIGGLHLAHRGLPRLFPQRLAGLGYAQEIQGRVDAAVLASTRENTKLCVIVGFSGGQEGIDIVQLAMEDNLDCRYLGLCGACDGTIGGLRKLTAPLYASDLRSDLVLIAMNPFHLVVRPYDASLQRSDIKLGADLQLLAGRRLLLELAGAGVDPRYQSIDPWRPMTKNYFGAVPDQTLRHRVEQYGARGYFDFTNYDVNGPQGQQLATMIEATRKRGAKVAIVLMPVHIALFRRLPHEATDALRDMLHRDLAGNAPPILDFQQAIGIAGFHDGSHLNGAGRKTFTGLLAAEIKSIID